MSERPEDDTLTSTLQGREISAAEPARLFGFDNAAEKEALEKECVMLTERMQHELDSREEFLANRVVGRTLSFWETAKKQSPELS